MEMKYILPLIVCMLSFMSCTKDSDFSVPDEVIHTPVKNAYRAVKISGTSTHWGKFTLNLKYGKEELENGILTNEKNDTVGKINVSREKGYSQFDIIDFVPNADSDSINRLKVKLDSIYGEGSYNLWDSIPKIGRTILASTVFPTRGGLVKKIITKSYRPHKNIHVNGEDFDNSYVLVSTKTHIYEFDANGNICVDRMITDSHNPEDQDLFKRTISKNEIEYSNIQIQSLVAFIAKSGENYSEMDHLIYSYDSDRLTGISGDNFTRKFNYSGNQVNVVDGANTIVIELDEHGNVISYNDGHGNNYQITYEQGHGNLSIFTPVEEQMKNPFYVK